MLAPNDAAAAQYYPAIYWFAMLKIPTADQFGGKSDIPEKITQADWLTAIKNQACVGCHQLGQLGTRTIPAALGTFKTGEEAWARRIQSGQAAPLMINPIAGKFNSVPLKYFGDWTDRIAKGELPSVKPPRPQGIERNVVVTTWDWGNDKQYLHDLISSDKRNPTVNAYGKLYGSTEYATDHLPVLDPKTGEVTYVTPPEGADVPEAFGRRRLDHAAIEKPMAASAYWGMEQVWDTKFDNHNDMFDEKGRVWMTGHQSRAWHAGLLPQGLGQPLCQSVSDRQERTPIGDVRSEDGEVHLHRYLLRHSSSAIRLRQGQHAVDQRRRHARRLAQHQGVRRDRRRRKSAKAGRRSCSTPTATASSTTSPSRASRAIPTKT